MNVKYTSIVRQMREEFPHFKVIAKEDSRLMRFIFAILLMRYWNPYFMTHYTTTMFGKVYMPYVFIDTSAGYTILRHERIHLQDAARYPVFFELSYLFLLPFGITMRAFWEYRAYCESLRVVAEMQGFVCEHQVDDVVRQFAGPYYLWMLPFPGFLKRKFLIFLSRNGIRVVLGR